jgi:hypothetical protein
MLNTDHCLLYNKHTLVACFVGWGSCVVKGFWALWNHIYECVRCYNRCNGNVIKKFFVLRGNIYDYVSLLHSTSFLTGHLLQLV